MRLINETRDVQLASRAGRSVEGREHIVGIDTRWAGRGVSFERHIPVEVRVGVGSEQTVIAIANDGLPRRILPYLAAPLLAIIVTRLFRRKG